MDNIILSCHPSIFITKISRSSLRTVVWEFGGLEFGHFSGSAASVTWYTKSINMNVAIVMLPNN